MARNAALDWLYAIVAGHFLMNVVAFLVVMLGLLLIWFIHPLLGVIAGLLIGGVLIFAFPIMTSRLLFPGRSKGERRGEGYLWLLGFATMALCFVGAFIAGGLVQFVFSDVIENVSPDRVLAYRDQNVFLEVVEHRVVYRLSGEHWESRQNPDKTTRTESFHAAPMFHRDLSADQVEELFSRGEACVWVVDRTEGSTYHVVASSYGYRQAVKNALGRRDLVCDPLFLMAYGSAQAAIDRNIGLLKRLILFANAAPLLLVFLYGLRNQFRKNLRRE